MLVVFVEVEDSHVDNARIAAVETFLGRARASVGLWGVVA